MKLVKLFLVLLGTTTISERPFSSLKVLKRTYAQQLDIKDSII